MGKRKVPTHKPVPCGVWVSKKREKQLLLPQPKRARLSSVTVIPSRQLGGARELPKRQATILEIFGRKDADSAASACSTTTSQVYDPTKNEFSTHVQVLRSKAKVQDHEKASDSKRLDATCLLPESAKQQIIQKPSQENYSTAHRISTVDLKSKDLSDEEEYSYSLTDNSENDQPLSPLKYMQNSEGDIKWKTPTKSPSSKTSGDIFTKHQNVNNSETLPSKTIWKPRDVSERGENVKPQKTTEKQTERFNVLSPPMYTLDTQGDLKVKCTTEHSCPQRLGNQSLTLHEKSVFDTMPCTEELSPLQYTLDTQGELVYNDNHPCHYEGAGNGQSEESHPLTCGPSDEDIEADSQALESEDLSQLKYTLDSEGELRCKEISNSHHHTNTPILSEGKVLDEHCSSFSYSEELDDSQSF